MKNLTQRLNSVNILIAIIAIFGNMILTSCNNGGSASNLKAPTKDAPISGTQEQQDIFRATFATEISKDSVWVNAFEKAFTGAFGADSLKRFLDRQTLPHLAVTGNQEIKGTERGEFVINAGAVLTVSGVVYGKIIILRGGELINRGAIYGNIENSYGEFEDSGFHQGALIMR